MTRVLEFLATRFPVAALIVLTLAAGAVRLEGLVSRPLWSDELAQKSISRQPDPRAVLDHLVYEDRNPPGHALLLYFVPDLGNDELTLRIMSFLAGIALVPVGWFLGRSVGPLAAVLTALLLGFAPVCVFYAREAKPYGTGLLVVTAFWLASARYLRIPSGRRAAVLAGTAVLAVGWQYANAVVVAAGLIGVSFGLFCGGNLRKRTFLHLVIVAAASGAVTVALALTLMKAQLDFQGNGSTQDFLRDNFYDLSSPASAAAFVRTRGWQFTEMIVAGSGLTQRPHHSWLCGTGILAVTAGAVSLLRSSPAHRGLGLGVVLGLVGFMLMAGLGLHPFGGRHGLPLLPGLAFVAAAGLTDASRRFWPVADAAVFSLAVLFVVGYAAVAGWAYYDVPDNLRHLRPVVEPGDAAVVVGVQACVMVEYYHAKDPFISELHLVQGDVLITQPTERDAVEKVSAVLARRGRVWVIDYGWEIPDFTLAVRAAADEKVVVVSHGVRATLWVSKAGAAAP